MAQITIGGIEYHIPEMNFIAIELAWPYVVKATSSFDPIEGASAALSVIAAGIMEAEDFDPKNFNITEIVDTRVHQQLSYYLKKRLKANEMAVLKDAMFEVLKEAGLEVTEGEATAALMAALETAPEEVTPSQETAPDTSSSSLQPDAKEEAGTP